MSIIYETKEESNFTKSYKESLSSEVSKGGEGSGGAREGAGRPAGSGSSIISAHAQRMISNDVKQFHSGKISLNDLKERALSLSDRAARNDFEREEGKKDINERFAQYEKDPKENGNWLSPSSSASIIEWFEPAEDNDEE